MVSFPLHASGFGSRTASLLRQGKDVSPQDAHVSSAQNADSCQSLPRGSAVLARPEAVLVTVNVLWLRLAGYGLVESVSAHRAEVTQTCPPEDFCSIRGALVRDGSLQRLCRGTVAVPIGRIPQSSFNQS